MSADRKHSLVRTLHEYRRYRRKLYATVLELHAPPHNMPVGEIAIHCGMTRQGVENIVKRHGTPATGEKL